MHLHVPYLELENAQAQHVVGNTEFGDTLVLLKGSPTDPNAAVIADGQMSLLEPLFASGERKMGYENWTPGWDPAIAPALDGSSVNAIA